MFILNPTITSHSDLHSDEHHMADKFTFLKAICSGSEAAQCYRMLLSVKSSLFLSKIIPCGLNVSSLQASKEREKHYKTAPTFPSLPDA